MAELYLSKCAKVFRRDNRYIVSFKNIDASKNAYLFRYLHDVGVGYIDRNHFSWKSNVIDIGELYNLLLKWVENDLIIDVHTDNISVHDVKNSILGDNAIKRGNNLFKLILKKEF